MKILLKCYHHTQPHVVKVNKNGLLSLYSHDDKRSNIEELVALGMLTGDANPLCHLKGCYYAKYLWNLVISQKQFDYYLPGTKGYSNHRYWAQFFGGYPFDYRTFSVTYLLEFLSRTVISIDGIKIDNILGSSDGYNKPYDRRIGLRDNLRGISSLQAPHADRCKLFWNVVLFARRRYGEYVHRREARRQVQT